VLASALVGVAGETLDRLSMLVYERRARAAYLAFGYGGQ
jgi:hypothetical protein